MLNMLNSLQFCVYLTIYSGNKLPPFYIGSTSIVKIKNGYRGSPRSKKFGEIFHQELKDNPHLFRTIIIRKYYSRKNAIYNERLLQIQFNVVKSNQFINMSIAAPNGFFGMNCSGKNSPKYGKEGCKGERNGMYGYKWGENHPKGMQGKKHSEESNEKNRKSNSGENSYWYGKTGENAPFGGNKPKTESHKNNIAKALTGVKHSDERRKNISIGLKGKNSGPNNQSCRRVCCVICKKETNVPGLGRNHKHLSPPLPIDNK